MDDKRVLHPCKFISNNENPLGKLDIQNKFYSTFMCMIHIIL